MNMRERIFTFGPNASLLGVLCEPAPDVAKKNAPALLATNVGMHHRVGPYRLYVDLARKLAAAGYTTLRFDLGGLGDSAARSDRVDDLGRALLDLKDAMHALRERRGIERFIAVGMCSGVDSTHAITVEDARVVGSVFIEGYAFRTREFYVRRYVHRLLTRRFWEVYLYRKLSKYVAAFRDDAQAAGDREEIFNRVQPTQEQLAREYAALVARKVHMLMVFAGGWGSDQGYNYKDQFAETFPALAGDPHFDLEYYPRADHTFSVFGDRERLIERIEQWLLARFPS